MKKLTLGLSLAALVAGGAAVAQAPAAKPDRDRTMTRAEAQTHAQQMFARLDANKDGRIDAADREARRAAMFDRLDANKDGQISRAEFVAQPARAERADGKGAERGMKRGGHRGHGGMMMGRMADANRDGAVTQAEFAAAALQRFDRMDANKDGQVTREERQAARSAMRQQKGGQGADPQHQH